ncbi:MAG: tetratricopeptide repeat protein [Flavobacteriales bacterium]|nr:tetratricopeptide repeat protein [Flavobacteriales bacterium]
MVKKAVDNAGQMDPRWMWLPVVLSILLYSMAVGHGFVLDDNLVITQNRHVQDGFSGIPDLLTTNYTHGHLDFNDGLYRPLSLITFAAESAIHGLDPNISHFIQALLYGLLLLILGKLLLLLFHNRPWNAFWILLLFAVHPIHTEVVANLKSRDEIMALLFFAWSAWVFVRYLNSNDKRLLAGAMGLYFLALFSKESAITFLVAFPLLHYFYRPDSWRKVLKTGALFAIPAAIFLGIRAWVLLSLRPVDSGVSDLLQNILSSSESWVERIATATVVQGFYLWKLLIPFPLSHDYSYHVIPVYDLTSPLFLASLITLLGILYLAYRGWKGRQWYAFGIVFYFIAISVVSNTMILIGALMAERFVFAPSLGWTIALVGGIGAVPFLSKRQTWLFAGMAGIFLLLSAQRIPDWKDNYTLFNADIDKVPSSARAHYNVGTANNDRAKIDPQERQQLRTSAIQHLRKAIEIWPEYKDAYNNLGVVYIDMGKLQEAYAVYQETHKRFPSYSKGLYNLGITTYKLGKFAEAESYFEAYLDQSSNNDVLFLTAESEGYQSKFEEAKEHLLLLIEREPSRARGPLKLGMAYGISGDQAQAEAYFNRAIRIEPRNAEAHLNLGLLYLNTQRPDLAGESLRNALALDPNLEQARQLLDRL